MIFEIDNIKIEVKIRNNDNLCILKRQNPDGIYILEEELLLKKIKFHGTPSVYLSEEEMKYEQVYLKALNKFKKLSVLE